MYAQVTIITIYLLTFTRGVIELVWNVIRLTDKFGMKKVAARWVPHLLSEHVKKPRRTSYCVTDGRTNPHRIVTLNEAIVDWCDLNTKRESMVWKCVSSPPH